MSRRFSMLLALCVVAACATLARAQCPQPDNLDGGPCCAITQLKVPPLPKFSQKSLGICWRDCKIDQVAGYIARWSQPFPAFYNGVQACGWFNARLQLYTGIT